MLRYFVHVHVSCFAIKLVVRYGYNLSNFLLMLPDYLKSSFHCNKMAFF